MGAVVISNRKNFIAGNRRFVFGTCGLSTTYTSGGVGDIVTATALGLQNIEGFFPRGATELGAAPAGLKVVEALPQSNGTVGLKVLVGTTGAEITGAPTDQTAITLIPFIAFGRS